MTRWFCLAVFAFIVACSGGSNPAPNAVPNAPMGTIGPKLHLRLAHLGKPHYFFSRNVFRARPKHRAHSGSYYYGIGNLQYGGGPVEVTPKAYLIFWGITGPADTTHDPDHLAPYLIDFFAALPNSRWLNTVTQYYGTYTGPTSYITNPTSAFTGTYYDSTLPPSTFTQSDIANEALKVANIVGYDANTNYIVVAAHGSTTSGFGTTFCAYHDWTTTVSSQLLSYTILPYIPDSPSSGSEPTGYSCGLDSVNNVGGTLDGVSIVGGHEEAETITDVNTATGWLDGSAQKMEVADKCAWIHLQNSSFPNAHSYPTQPLWSNASASCVQSYGSSPTPSPTASPTPPPSTNVVLNPGFESGRLKPWGTCHSKGRIPAAFVTTNKPHGGKYDAYAGTIQGHSEPDGMTSVCQLVSIPARAQLTVWTRGISDDNRNGVYQFARLYNTSGTIAKTLFKIDRNEKKWHKWTFNLSGYSNGQYMIEFGVQGKADARGRYLGLYVDDVSIK